jgi:hypothetical protein
LLKWSKTSENFRKFQKICEIYVKYIWNVWKLVEHLIIFLNYYSKFLWYKTKKAIRFKSLDLSKRKVNKNLNECFCKEHFTRLCSAFEATKEDYQKSAEVLFNASEIDWFTSKILKIKELSRNNYSSSGNNKKLWRNWIILTR